MDQNLVTPDMMQKCTRCGMAVTLTRIHTFTHSQNKPNLCLECRRKSGIRVKTCVKRTCENVHRKTNKIRIEPGSCSWDTMIPRPHFLYIAILYISFSLICATLYLNWRLSKNSSGTYKDAHLTNLKSIFILCGCTASRKQLSVFTKPWERLKVQRGISKSSNKLYTLSILSHQGHCNNEISRKQ